MNGPLRDQDAIDHTYLYRNSWWHSESFCNTVFETKVRHYRHLNQPLAELHFLQRSLVYDRVWNTDTGITLEEFVQSLE